MVRYIRKIMEHFPKGDKVLLLLCLVANSFGCLVIASATNYMGYGRFIGIQMLAALIGITLYAIMSNLDADRMAEHKWLMFAINVAVLALLIPFGTDNDTGNRSWLDIPGLPFNIQPAEICKITFILIMASVMNTYQGRISSVGSIWAMALQVLLLCLINMVLSKDLGVTLIFVFIAIGMTFSGGVSLIWYLILVGGLGLLSPFIWANLSAHRRLRLQILWDPSLDAAGVGARYHTIRSLRSLTGGGLTGQGLFDGHRTQNGALFAQHTDYIFSAIGEELGFLGCIFTIVLLLAIIARCIWVGRRSPDYLRRMICYGAASALIFQVTSNVGMCLGITPVIGLTLPFISYGGSSLVSLYAMLGLVSGVYAHPTPTAQERYIQPPLTDPRRYR